MKYVFSTCEYELGLDSPTVWTIKSQRAVLCLKKSVVTTASGRELFLCVLAQSREEFLYVAKKVRDDVSLVYSESLMCLDIVGRTIPWAPARAHNCPHCAGR